MTSLSSQERTVIQTLLELNYSVRAIARFIKRSPYNRFRLKFI